MSPILSFTCTPSTSVEPPVIWVITLIGRCPQTRRWFTIESWILGMPYDGHEIPLTCNCCGGEFDMFDIHATPITDRR